MQALTRLGIAGLDGKLPPIPRGYSILLSGPSGSGKTIFALQFLYESASKYGERGVFISLRDLPSNIRRKAASIGFEISELEKNNMLIIVDALSRRIGIGSGETYIAEPSFNGIIRAIKIISQEFEKIDRVVIDPISILFRGRNDIEDILKLILTLTSLNATTLAICFLEDLSILSYLFNGVIELQESKNGIKTMIIRKMEYLRVRTPISLPYEIKRGIGIRVVEQTEGGF